MEIIYKILLVKKTLPNCLFAILILFSSCNHPTFCPGFNEMELHWTPYKESQELIFSSGKDTLKLVINKVELDKSSNISDKCKCECVPRATITTSTDSIYKLGIEFECYYFPADSTKYTAIVFHSLEQVNERDTIVVAGICELKFEKNRIDSINSSKITPLENYKIRNKYYSNVFKVDIEGYPNENCRINQFYLADSVGIIQFTDAKNQKVWSLVE